jgi:membrane protein implicated in regulation of membrane protease activity
VKEFLVYTGLRLALFVGSVLVVGGLWALVTGDTQVPAVWVVLVAFLVSGVVSVFLLNRPREAFARRVSARAEAASARLQRARAKEDETG